MTVKLKNIKLVILKGKLNSLETYSCLYSFVRPFVRSRLHSTQLSVEYNPLKRCFLWCSCFVFRQLREQSKKLVGVKRNQQLEREKQAELLNEVKKQEDQKDETTEYFQVTSQAYSAGAMASWVVLGNSIMGSALDSGSSGLGSNPGRGHCVMFLGKTLHSHSASLHPSV